MASDAPSYGLDAELKAKQEAKYDVGLERLVVEWIESLTGEQQGEASVHEWLKNGHILCAVANAVKPGAVKKVNTSNMPFKQMENITYFMNAARDIGVPESAMFGTPDLYEEKNMGSVMNCIYTFGGVVQVTCPEFTGPKLGVPVNVESKSKKREGGIATQSGGLATTLEVERPENKVGYLRPATGERKKSSRSPSPRPRNSSDAAKASPPPKVKLDGPVEGTPNEECVYGIDKDLKAKQAAKYDPELEREVTEWIEAITDQKKEDKGFAEWLKDGHVLCALANAIKPGIVKKVNASSMPFKQMENITYFMNAARELGVPESGMFGTPDLYEEKNIGSVVTCIFQLGGAIQVSTPEFKGPKLGNAVHHDSKDKKRGSGLLTDMSAGFQQTMEVARPTDRADYCVRHMG